MPPFENPFEEYIEAKDPTAQYFRFQPEFGRSPSQRRYFQGQFKNIHNEFLGAMARQLQGPEPQELRFGDFMGDYDFGARFQSLSPRMRGSYPQQFAPSTRRLFF
jgi:hypothetical protein